MQRKEIVDENKLQEVLASVYEGGPTVFQAYSNYDQDVLSFPKCEDLEAHISNERAAGRANIYFAIHYPETLGLVLKKQIHLRPEHCGGATLRYSIEGWGLIQLQLDYKGFPAIECRFAVNTEKRALAWYDALPALGEPARWEWKSVERQVRRLIRVLRRVPSNL